MPNPNITDNGEGANPRYVNEYDRTNKSTDEKEHQIVYGNTLSEKGVGDPHGHIVFDSSNTIIHVRNQDGEVVADSKKPS